jgi:hypothetical protein
MKKKKFILGFILGLILLNPAGSFSQNQSLFEIINEKELSLKSEHSLKLEKLKKNKLYKSIELIKLGNVSKLSKTNNGALPIKIPGITKSYIAKPVEIEYFSEEDFIWRGEFKKDNGYINLICKNNEIFGNIQIGDRFFEIQSFEPKKNIIIEYNEAELSKMTCGFGHGEKIVENEKPNNDITLKSTTATTTTTRANVRILVLYTDAATAAVPNINNTAGLAISQINNALSNSAISSNLIVTLAGVEHLEFNESPNIHDDIDALSNNFTALNLRNTYEADLVVLLTDGNYDYDNGVNYIYGIVDNIGPSNSDAYAIVEADCTTSSKYTFAHEVGHLFGGLHENDLSGTYEHGYFFYTGIWPFGSYTNTIMLSNGDKPRILHYSNPNVKYQNKATGTTYRHNVARKLKEEAPIVEGFRQSIPLLSVYISGPTTGYNMNMYTWYANVSGGAPPYSYSWNYSLDGFTYEPTISQSSSYSGILPYNNNLYLRVTIGSSDGQSSVDFHTIINRGSLEELKSKTIPEETSATEFIKLNTQSIVPFEFTIYPNPVQDFSTAIYYLNEDALVSLEIFDINGRRINTVFNTKQDRGSHSLVFNTTNFESGIYLCKLSINGHTFHEKFIVK